MVGGTSVLAATRPFTRASSDRYEAGMRSPIDGCAQASSNRRDRSSSIPRLVLQDTAIWARTLYSLESCPRISLNTRTM